MTKVLESKTDGVVRQGRMHHEWKFIDGIAPEDLSGIPEAPHVGELRGRLSSLVDKGVSKEQSIEVDKIMQVVKSSPISRYDRKRAGVMESNVSEALWNLAAACFPSHSPLAIRHSHTFQWPGLALQR